MMYFVNVFLNDEYSGCTTLVRGFSTQEEAVAYMEKEFPGLEFSVFPA